LEAENIKIKPAPKDRKLSPSPFGNRLESAKFAVIRIDGLPVARLLTKHRRYTNNPKNDAGKASVFRIRGPVPNTIRTPTNLQNVMGYDFGAIITRRGEVCESLASCLYSCSDWLP